MNAFVDGGFLSASIVVIFVVAACSALPVIPFLVKKKYSQANFYFWLIDIPITIALVGPMVSILFDEGYGQVGWVFYFAAIPFSVIYYLIILIFLVVKHIRNKE